MSEEMRRAAIAEIQEARNELVQGYTARMQAETLPKTVFKLMDQLSKECFELDLAIYSLEALSVVEVEA